MAGSAPAPLAVIFDLDGTLVQTRESSWAVFAEVNREFGLGVDTPQAFYALLEDNLFASLRATVSDDRTAAAVKASFLSRLDRDYHPALVPGIGNVLRVMAGVSTLAVLSGNTTRVVRRILEENELSYCFAHVFGSDLVESKRQAIREFLVDPSIGTGRRCSTSYDEGGPSLRPDAATTVLVTDTAGDVREALGAGIRAVGVSWGMHDPQGLLSAGAEFVATWPQELVTYLFGDVHLLEPRGACAVPVAAAPVEGVPAGSDPGARCAGATCAGDCDGCPASGGCGTSECGGCRLRPSAAPGATGDVHEQARRAMDVRRRRRAAAGAETSRPAARADQRRSVADADAHVLGALRTILRT